MEGLAARRKGLRTGQFVDLVTQFQPPAAYLETAAANLPEMTPGWRRRAGRANCWMRCATLPRRDAPGRPRLAPAAGAA